MKIAVTGGSGKAGRAIVRDLLEHGHDVLNVDRVPSAESFSPDSPAPLLLADLTDFGQDVVLNPTYGLQAHAKKASVL